MQKALRRMILFYCSTRKRIYAKKADIKSNEVCAHERILSWSISRSTTIALFCVTLCYGEIEIYSTRTSKRSFAIDIACGILNTDGVMMRIALSCKVCARL